MERLTWIASASALLPLTSISFASSTQSAKPPERENWIVHAEHVYTGTGSNLVQGAVVVNNGKIAAVTRDPGDDNSQKAIKVYAITPGLVDASARITSGAFSVEQSKEVTPDLRVADTLDIYATAWEELLLTGVTTILENPLDQNVIGGLGVVIKTAGDESMAARTLKKDAVLRGSMGTQPSQGNHAAFGRPTDFFSRRPTTRMAVEWEWRRTFLQDVPVGLEDKTQRVPGHDVLVLALKGQLPLSIQAWTTQDIRTAVFLKEEVERDSLLAKAGLNKLRLVLDASAEAWKEPELLVRSKTAVVLPPFSMTGRGRENSFMAWNTAKELHDQGVEIALSAHGNTSIESSLGMQAGYAMRGGLPFEEALAAVTLVPARILGVDDRVGTLEMGKDADIVMWNGEPFEPGSRVVGVIVDGVLRLDPRPPKTSAK